MNALRSGMLRLLTARGVTASLAPLMRGRATIFMLHRFRYQPGGGDEHDPVAVRAVLARLRRERYELLPLEVLFRRLLGEGATPKRAVAFTIDDGYFDHATVAAPLFAEFDCPVTTFVTTGFLDGLVWFWWDRIEHIFTSTSQRGLSVHTARESLSFAWTTPLERAAAQAAFLRHCKTLDDADKHAAIAALARAADVELPDRAPEQYSPMTWDQLRACERAGMTFGPHTVTHPVLTRTDDTQSRYEILESWRRLREEAVAPVPVFCYPNGGANDFGAREIAALREAGLIGAVVGEPGYADAGSIRSHADARFRVRRFADADSTLRVVQFASGIERLRELVRGG